MSRAWLVSPRFDLALLSGPALLSATLALLLPRGLETPAWGFLLLVLCVDVGHVWSSVWRTYADADMRAQRPVLLLLTPVLCLLSGVALHGLSPGLFWTGMAYLAVWHFMRQQLGFTALYRMVQGLPPRSLDARIERALVYALTGWPILWWHTQLPLDFDWFMPGDFLPGLPSWVLAPAGLVTLGLALAHGLLRWRSGLASPGRDLWLLGTALTWFGGIVLAGGDLAFTLSNVVAHGVPYYALVAWTVRNKAQQTGGGPGRHFFGWGLALFLLPLLALAWLEEGLWDALVWQEHPWLAGGLNLSDWAGWWAVPLLSLPQLTHYVLDGFIWKMDQNPGLKGWILGDNR